MIQIFCSKRGTGKSKRLIELANEHSEIAKGDSVYIDDDRRRMMQLNSKIRFIDTNELKISECKAFYGLLCGLISQNYDVENIYIDAISNIVNMNITESIELFNKMQEFSNKYNINIFVNLNCDSFEELPDSLKVYSA